MFHTNPDTALEFSSNPQGAFQWKEDKNSCYRHLEHHHGNREGEGEETKKRKQATKQGIEKNSPQFNENDAILNSLYIGKSTIIVRIQLYNLSAVVQFNWKTNGAKKQRFI